MGKYCLGKCSPSVETHERRSCEDLWRQRSILRNSEHFSVNTSADFCSLRNIDSTSKLSHILAILLLLNADSGKNIST